MEIVWDQESNKILVGKAEFATYINWKGWKEWAKAVVIKNDGWDAKFPHHPKDLNKFLAEKLGCTPSKMYKHFQKLQYKAFVAPYKDVFMKVGFKPGRIDERMLMRVIDNYAVCKQVYDDGLYNILPIVAFTGKSPVELKKEYKSKWKVIANNSLNKNKAIVNTMRKGWHNLENIADLPTTVLMKCSGNDWISLQYIAQHFKGKWSKSREMHREVMLFDDTRRMAEQVGKTVSYKWTPRRVKEEHDRMAKELNAQKYSPAPFPVLETMNLEVLEYAGFVATPLVSAKAIADEGATMGHCVAGYINSVRNGSYLVYSVTKDGERTSTIGLRKHYKMASEDSRWDINQQYGRFNKPVDDEDERDIVDIILSKLNKDECILTNVEEESTTHV